MLGRTFPWRPAGSMKEIVLRSAALLLIGVLLAACVPLPTTTPAPPIPKGTGPSAGTPPPPVTTPTPSPTPLSAAAILQAALDAQAAAKTYRFAVEGQYSIVAQALGLDLTIPYTFAGDYQAPDRLQGQMSITTLGFSQGVDVITIGDTYYVKSPDSAFWRKSDQIPVAFDPGDFTSVKPSGFERLEFAGEETLDGVPVYHLKGSAPFLAQWVNALGPAVLDALGKPEGFFAAEYWVGREDGKLLKSVVQGEATFSGKTEATFALSVTQRISDYGAPVAIEAPQVGQSEPAAVRAAAPVTVTETLMPALAGDGADAHLARGLAALAGGRFGLAVAHFDRVVAERPDWPDGYLYRGASQAIDGDSEAAMADLGQAIELAPDRADAYTLRAWAHLRAMVRKEEASDTALAAARQDAAKALALQPDLADALALKATADLWQALALYESDPAKATAQLQTGIAGLEALLAPDSDAAAGIYFSLYNVIYQVKLGQDGWLQQQVEEADAQVARDGDSYIGYARRGLAELIMASMSLVGQDMLQRSEEDLLRALVLAHRRMVDTADLSATSGEDQMRGGPLQVARIWDLQEAIYGIGTSYLPLFRQDPAQRPEFAGMLTTYWELLDLLQQVVDDPIVFAVAVSPDGKKIATVSESGPSYLRAWDTNSKEKLLDVELATGSLVVATTHGSVSFSPDGQQILVSYTNPAVHLVDAGTGEIAQSFTEDANAASAAFSPDGGRVVTVGHDGTVHIWDAKTGEQLLSLAPEAESEIGAVAFSPDGRLVIGGGDPVHVWDAGTGKLVRTLPGYDPSYTHAPAVSPDSRRVAVPGGPVRIYDLETGEELSVLEGLGARSVVFSPDGSSIAAAVLDGTARVWDAKTGKTLMLAGHPRGVNDVAFSPDGKLLVTGGVDGRFRVWDVETGAELWSRLAVTLW